MASSKRIVGYVISHTGKPGGPWEATHGRFGTATTNREHRLSTKDKRNLFMLNDVKAIHPSARILRLVRRERHRAEEAAVVEAALAWERWRNSPRPAPKSTFRELALAGNRLAANCAALRAKRGG